MPIRILDAATIGKISAGEVVERPASAAKELIENALDAGSTAITVEVKDGGNSYLRVTDNGCGIPANEVRMAFENHATSKLSGEKELTDVRTLGFRGEALPSIAAVSRVEMTTRQRGADVGMKIQIEGGKVMSLREAGCPEGTTIIMRDIFFNTPVRRAFLKKGAYEFGVIAETVGRMILGNPKVAIRLLNNGKTVYHSFGDGQLRHAVLAVYGRETAESVLEIDEAEGGMRLSGVIGVGEQARPTRAHQAFFINGRSVRCPLLQRALEEAVRGRVMIGQYPMCALSIQLSPTNVDVNVHPNKLEVRFRDEAAVKQSLDALLARALNSAAMLSAAQTTQQAENVVQPQTTVTNLTNRESGEQQSMFAGSVRLPDARTEAVRGPLPPARGELQLREGVPALGRIPAKPIRHDQEAAPSEPSAAQRTQEPSERRPAPTGGAGEPTVLPIDRRKELKAVQANAVAAQSPAGGRDAGGDDVRPATANGSRPTAEQPQDNPPSGGGERPARRDEAPLPSYRIVGTLFQTYIILEFQDAVLLIDQHAAHERIRFEQYKKLLDEHCAAQQLLTPLVLRLSPRELALVEGNREVLAECGYEVEPFGQNDIRVLSVPHILGRTDTKLLFVELIDHLDQLRSATRDARLAEIMQMSCKHAVKAGDVLSTAEINALIAQMVETGAPPTCPHGRPVLHKLTKRDLEHMFRRIQ